MGIPGWLNDEDWAEILRLGVSIKSTVLQILQNVMSYTFSAFNISTLAYDLHRQVHLGVEIVA